MVKALKKLKSLKGRAPRELRVRAAQKLAACAERTGLSGQTRVPSDAAFFKLLADAQPVRALGSAEDLLEHFSTRREPRFFAAFNNPEETVKELRRRFGPQREERTIERAEKIINGRFDLLGFRNLSFGEKIDWHLEPVSGKRVPLRHWSRIDYLDRDVAGDKKIIWELNRHQYFATLGRAYWYTHDERFAQTFVAHLTSWMDHNPPKLGINWASSLEVAFRSISWLWALYFFKDSKHLAPDVFLRALKFLYLNARHLETYLSTYFSPNTHLTGEALGLFYMGTLLPEFRRSKKWLDSARRILTAELDRHVLRDGVYFERSSYYHRYTADFYTHFLTLSEANGTRVESEVQEKLTALLDHLMFIERPDGTTPLFGDDDGGRLLMLDERQADDFRATLSTGAALFERGDYKWVAGELAEETFWLLGQNGAESFDHLSAGSPSETSQAFTDGGYYVMRDGWSRDANYLLIDCGAHGALNCGHAHADALSLDLSARGRAMLVDPGTYTYTGDASLRDYFRSSAAHNTLVVDGESSSVPAGPFSWTHVANARPTRWTSHASFDLFEGEHDGYTRLPEPATHRRAILFIKDRYWVMRDRVESNGPHACELYFHFAPHAEAANDEAEAALRVCANGPDEKLEILTFGEGGGWRAEDGWVSRVYGERERARVRVFSASTQGAQEFFTFLIPRGAQEETVRTRVRELEAARGRAFEVMFEETRDLLLAGCGEMIKAEGTSSDFEWAWARSSREGDVLEELVVACGRRFSLEGREIVKASERVDYLVARRAGSALIVETNARGQLALSPCGARVLSLNGVEFEAGGAPLHFKDGVLVRSVEGAGVETFV